MCLCGGRIRGEHPATRQFVRWTESAPLVNAFGVWLDEQCSRVSPKSRLGERLTYIANQWDGLLTFLHDGRVADGCAGGLKKAALGITKNS